MLGYIKIYPNELKLRNVRDYKNLYCKLCTALGRDYGIIYRMFVSYDVTFFISIFDALSENKVKSKIDCPLNRRINKSILISDKAIEYGSLISIYWILQKIRDDKTDLEYGLKNLILDFLLKHNKKVSNKLSLYENLLNRWNTKMEKYYKTENNPESTFDMLINSIGEVYGTVFDCYADFANIKIERKLLFDLGFNIGVYIFLMDAYDDYFQDMRKNKFNPIFKMLDYEKIKENKSQIKEKVNILTQFLIEKIKSYVHQLNIQEKANNTIIENIVVYGMKYVYYQITKQKYEEGKCKKCFNQNTV